MTIAISEAQGEVSSELPDKSVRKSRVLLIKSKPNDPNWRFISYPLGLMYVAAYLRRKYSYEVRIVDTRINETDQRKIQEIVRDFAPDVVGISALTFESYAVPWIAECVKSVNPLIPVILGGPHSTAYPEKAIDTPDVDYLVVGEGESTAGELIERLVQSRDISNVKGIVYKRDDQIVATGRPDFIQDLDELPIPAYDLISITDYENFDRFDRSKTHGYMNVISSRGCPYRCVYCHNVFGKVFRARSAENLFNEIKYLYETYRVHDFDILDDIFNYDRKRLIRFCELVVNQA